MQQTAPVHNNCGSSLIMLGRLHAAMRELQLELARRFPINGDFLQEEI